jgi:hypothetical protein
MKPWRYAVIAALVLVAACSRLTIENYDRLKVGMTFAEVKQILGDPAKCDEVVGVRNCVWGDDVRNVKVSFAADRVMLLSATGLK